MKVTMYNVQDDYMKLMSEIEYAEGVLTPEMEEQLIITEGQIQHKSMSYISVIETKEAFNMQIDTEIKRLQAMKKVNGNLIGRLKETLLGAVNLYGEITVGLRKIGTRKSTSVQIDEGSVLPNDLKVVKISEQPDKKAIKQRLKDGIEVEGCRLVDNINLKIN